MAEVLKVLGQASPAATTEADLYTVPGATAAVASTLVICNRNASNVTFRVSVSVGGGATANADYIYYDTRLLKNDSTFATIGITLGAADKVRVYSDTANVSFSLYGTEVS